MIIECIAEVETGIERPFLILLLSILMKPRTGRTHTEAVSQLLPSTIVLHITVRNGLAHLGMVEQRSIVKIVRITLRVLDAGIQSSAISKALFINALGDEGIFLSLDGRGVIHYWLIIQELLVLALSSSPHIRTHGIEGKELLVLQVALIVNVERRGEIRTMIHVDAVGHQLRIFFRIELSLFLTGRVSPMIQLGGDVQHVFISVLEVVGQSAIAVIAFGIDRFRLLVPMILASVLEGECLGTLVPKFFEVLLVGSIVETDFRLAEVQLPIYIVITKPTLGTLRSVVAKRTTHIVTTHHIVHHRIGFSIT